MIKSARDVYGEENEGQVWEEPKVGAKTTKGETMGEPEKRDGQVCDECGKAGQKTGKRGGAKGSRKERRCKRAEVGKG